MKRVNLNDIMDKLDKLRTSGNQPGVSTGFKTLDEFYTVKKGNTTIITGWPTSGKTQFMLQLQTNLTALHNWRHVIYSPETGDAPDIYAEIIHCLTGKTFNNKYSNHITESEMYDAASFTHDYFRVLEPVDNEITPEHWYESVKEIQSEMEVHTASIDNWNDVEHDMNNHGGKISEYLKFHLPKFNRFCKTRNIHGFLLAHPRNPETKGKESLPPPRPDQIEGGSLWWAKAQSLIVVDRDWTDPKSTTTDILVQKVKPKIVGKKGNVSLQFAAAWNCYYEEIGTDLHYPESPFKVNGKPV